MSEENTSQAERLHAIIEGRVQGVGFRYFVEEKAAALGVTGWVRNRWNRSVEVVAEGERYRVGDRLAPHFRPGPDDLVPFLAHSHHLYESWGENLERWLQGEEWSTRPRGPAEIAQFGAAMYLLFYLFEIFITWVLWVNLQLDQRGIGLDDGQKIVKIIGNASCEGANGSHFLGLLELCFEFVL